MGKTYEEQKALKAKLDEARQSVEIGAKYQHYKAEDKIYTVLHLAFQEENTELCVIYQAEYEEKLIFIRPLSSWLETIKWNDKVVSRFTKIS